MSSTEDDQVHPRKRTAASLFRWGIAVTVTGLLLAYGSSFEVREAQNVIVTRFGNPVRTVRQPGLHWKIPWPIEQVHAIDMRYQYFNTPLTTTFTRDRKNVVLLSYVVWRVDNALLFFQSLGTAKAAEQKLGGMVAAGKNFHMGNYDLAALVSTVPGEIQTDRVEAGILADVQPPAREKFGIQVEQIGIKRIAYPEENIASVLDQMRAERRAEAGQLRAEGKKNATQIRNDALVKAEEILRDGREEAGKIRGRAENRAAEIYAQAHRLDPQFYEFWRSMQVIKKTLGRNATVILRNDQQPFEQLFSSPPTVSTVKPLSPPADSAAVHSAEKENQP
jgi:membrane protease subunit HflC